MADFGKINPEKAQAIIKALKDGKINQNEMKQLGLTEAEAQELTKAFSSGQVEIGDFVLVNKGKVNKDGKEFQLSSTHKKQKPAEEESGFLSKAKTIGKYVGAAAAAVGVAAGGVALATGALASMPAWAPLALIAAGGVLLTSCSPGSEKVVEATQNQTMNIKMQDYSRQIDQILQRMDKMNDSISGDFKVMLANLQLIINNQYLTKQELGQKLDDFMKDMEKWLKEIANNQNNIRIDNNKNAADILAAIKAIIDNNGNVDAKLDELIKLITQIKIDTGDIKNDTNEIKDTTNSILEEIKKAKDDLKATLNTNNQAVLDAIAKLNDNDQKTLSVLNDIKALIKTYGDAGKELGEQILVTIGNISGNVDLSEVLKLLEKLVNGQQKIRNNSMLLSLN